MRNTVAELPHERASNACRRCPAQPSTRRPFRSPHKLAGMWRAIGTAVSILVVVGGVVLRLPWGALDVLGRLSTMLDAPDVFGRIIDWLAAHPYLAVDLGPWILILGGVGSLCLIHWSSLTRLSARGLHRTSHADAQPYSQPRRCIPLRRSDRYLALRLAACGTSPL